MDYTVSLTAVGDISFFGRNTANPSVDIFSAMAPVFRESDIVIANLEGPLLNEGDPTPGKFVLRGCTGWADVMRDSGINILSLANNHMMDYGDVGLLSTINSLKKAALLYVGAGENLEEACSPIFFDVKGTRAAILARTSVIVSSPSYAGARQPGVAFLDREETKNKIKDCKEQADVVILVIHWGLEEYMYPSPEQRLLAREFIHAGADLIFGHHPHVLQGIEQIENGFVAYSLGNLLFDDFEWESNIPNSKPEKILFPLSEENRKGIGLKASKDENNYLRISKIFTKIDNDRMLVLDNDAGREVEFDSLSKKFGSPLYTYWWRCYAIRREWSLRIKSRVSLKNIARNIWKLHPKHLKELFQLIRRSSKIVREDTTNPYE